MGLGVVIKDTTAALFFSGPNPCRETLLLLSFDRVDRIETTGAINATRPKPTTVHAWSCAALDPPPSIRSTPAKPAGAALRRQTTTRRADGALFPIECALNFGVLLTDPPIPSRTPTTMHTDPPPLHSVPVIRMRVLSLLALPALAAAFTMPLPTQRVRCCMYTHTRVWVGGCLVIIVSCASTDGMRWRLYGWLAG